MKAFVESKNQTEYKISYPTSKATRVPLAVHSRNIVFRDRSIASSTLKGKHLQEVISAIRFAIFFMKSILTKLFSALSAEEMLWMPCFLQGSDAFLE